MKFHLVLRSGNKKTGPIPVSTTSMSSCPKSCELYNECYAKQGPLLWHWKKINERGDSWKTFLRKIEKLPEGQLWRHNQAGDLPGDGWSLDGNKIHELCMANNGKRGFTYTHYPLHDHNVKELLYANKNGFTVNASCETREQVWFARSKGLPTVLVLPTDVKWRRKEGVLVCPAYWRDDMTCAKCGICQDSSWKRVTIGFPAHGVKKRVINLKLEKA